MAGNRKLPVILATMLAVVSASAARAEAAGIAAKTLQQPALTALPRIGALIVGYDVPEARAGYFYAAASLVAAGHRVVGLPGSPVAPPSRALLEQCAAHDLDAVALVRISTDGDVWRVNVDIRDGEGKPIAIGSEPGSQSSTETFAAHGSGSLVPVFATYWFTMSAADVQAAATAAPPVEVIDDTRADRPHLWVSKNVAMLGPVRIRDAEFYKLVGHPELNKRNSGGVIALRALGFTSLGVGVTTLVLAGVAGAFEAGFCAWPNTYDSLSGQEQTCGKEDHSGWVIAPLALMGLGGALVAGSYAMAADPVSLETRKALAREYNARTENPGAPPPSSETARPAPRLRLSVSGGPLAHGDGGLMLINGRF
jgi:hypothetical protein